MYIHFIFKNGSNPYLFYGTELECDKELKKWSKNWCCFPVSIGKYGDDYVLEECSPY